jgi:type VI secretion system protein ImpK
MMTLTSPVQAPSSIPVFEHFTAFWREVTAIRDAAAATMPEKALDGSSEEANALMHPGGLARRRLINFLERQAAQVIHSSPPGAAEMYREAQYVMAALADELFLTEQIGGEGFWGGQLLETHFFRTRFAGEAIFERIDSLLASPGADRNELAAVYLTALALGFRGRYRHRDDRGALAGYRARLHAMIYGRAARPSARRLVPAAYESTLNAGAGRKLRDPVLWWLATPAVLLAWLAISTLMWISIQGRVHSALEPVQRAIGSAGASR